MDAACHGVKVLHPGECPPVCASDHDCEVGYVCNPSPLCDDPCGCPDFCTPCNCPDVWDPVCGVDGATYGNACYAYCTHVEVAHKGECP
jgi:hypothetical protein